MSVAMWDETHRAVQTGGAMVAKNEQEEPIGSSCTPYCAIHEAKRPLVLGDITVRKGERFTFERAAEGGASVPLQAGDYGRQISGRGEHRLLRSRPAPTARRGTAWGRAAGELLSRTSARPHRVGHRPS